MYKLKNYNEEIVEHLIYKTLDEYENICKCEKCILDIKAIALNSLAPKYVVTDKGELFMKLEYEFDSQKIASVTKYIVDAIEIVSKNPKH